MPTLITTADDFGLTLSVNEAVEQAARSGILTSASLMVAAPAAADAIARAKRCPPLHVGLHLVLIEGSAVLPASKIPDLVDENGRFPNDQFAMGFRYFFRPAIRRQLAAEIRAQFESFAATGLPLDHANAHKHMHLHPVVGRLMIDIGRQFGLRAIRVPTEPPGVPPDAQDRLSDRALRAWSGLLRRQARRAGLLTNDHLLGLRHTGQMTQARVQTLLQRLPPGLTEIYFHPATASCAALRSLMPAYDHTGELAALLTTNLPQAIRLAAYSQLRANPKTL